jgi:hypothetical protein
MIVEPIGISRWTNSLRWARRLITLLSRTNRSTGAAFPESGYRLARPKAETGTGAFRVEIRFISLSLLASAVDIIGC